MSIIDIYDPAKVVKRTVLRQSSLRIGETIDTVESSNNWQEEVAQSSAQFVLLGVEETIGLRAAEIHPFENYVFDQTLAQFINLQDNLYLSGAEILILGKIHTGDLMDDVELVAPQSIEELSQMVVKIDDRLSVITDYLMSLNKIPIVISGGQNNAYALLRSLSKINKKQVNALAISAISCLSPTRGRNARNPYSYALEDGILQRYFAFGLHENEIPNSVYEFILANENQVNSYRYESYLESEDQLVPQLQKAIDFVGGEPFGFDINLNSLSENHASPEYPDGFQLRELRRLVRNVNHQKKPGYFHLSEAYSGRGDQKSELIVGKALALLVADFIKSYREETEK